MNPRFISCCLIVASCAFGCRGQLTALSPWRPEPGRDSIDPDDPVAPPPEAPAVADAPMARLTPRELFNTVEALYGPEAAGLMGEASSFEGASVGEFSAVEAVAHVSRAEAVAELVHQRPDVITCDPSDRDACTMQIVREQGRRILRHPMDDARVARYVAAAATQPSFEAGVFVVIAALMSAPDFLYRIERGVEAEPGVRRLTDHEMASRLSYALWRSMPDEVLFRAAAAGELSTREQVQAQVGRMLQDPRARGVVVGFHRWWLHLDDAGAAFRDSSEHPGFDPSHPEAWVEETERFVERTIFDGEGTLTELFTAAHGWLDPTTADTYSVHAADEDTPTALPPTERAGLLTQASMLAGHVPDARVASIYRGAFIYREVLCGELSDPPADIPPLPEADPHASVREQIEATTGGAPCSSCHDRFNPLGFALGRYDALGYFAERDANGQVVDDAVELSGPGDLRGVEVSGGVELANEIADSAALRDCYIDRWFRYLTGRHIDAAGDEGYSRALTQYEFEVTDRNVAELLVSLLSSDAFRYVSEPSEE